MWHAKYVLVSQTLHTLSAWNQQSTPTSDVTVDVFMFVAENEMTIRRK